MNDMPKYLVTGRYNAPAGVQGLLKEGGTGRRDAVAKLIEGLGGKLESMYFAYGENDVYAIVDAPDAATMTALSLNINASGAVSLTTVPLITPEEVDLAVKKQVGYRAPGG
jgi:uncharacterized protein with GYD domain